MDFWGVEVPAGKPTKVAPHDDHVIHLSHASLGECKKDKGNKPVLLYVNIDKVKHVLGTLSAEKFPQQTFDLAFNKEVELSHNWENGSVHFLGYQAHMPGDQSSDEYLSSEEEDMQVKDNGKIDQKSEAQRATAKQATPKKEKEAKPKSKQPEPLKIVKPEDEDEDASDDEHVFDDKDVSEPDSEEESFGSSDDDMSEDSDDDMSEDEETPKEVEMGKKRHNESASKTPLSKKSKTTTPKSADGNKKGVHVATPYPSKAAAKNAHGKSAQTSESKSPGTVVCKSCEGRVFKNESALQAHKMAKHGGK